MSKILILLIISTAFITSCKNDDDNSTVNTTQTENSTIKMLKRAWKVSKVTQEGITVPIYQNPLPTGQIVFEDYSQYKITFSSDTDFSFVERNGQSTNGKWELTSDNKKIVLNKGIQDKEKVFNILLINSSSLKINYTENNNKTGNREITLELIPV